ncbi:MAG: glycosyltransferase family 2 protein [Hamadaea sp.]|nr:glycosyltransferase family 2 protein [Hamadaea sp.]
MNLPLPAPPPVLVLAVEITAPLPTLASDGRHQEALLLLLRDGVPVGRLTVPCGIDQGELSARIAAVAGDSEPRPAVDPGDLPFISVVVPSVFERGDLLLATVESLVKQDYPRFEIIVVDNRPSPDHHDLIARLQAFPVVRVEQEPKPGKSHAGNRGLLAARGEVVTFTDDDVDTPPGWLTSIGSRFAAEPHTAAVTGPLVPTELETPAQIWFERAGGVATSLSKVTFRRRPGTFTVTTSRGETMSLYQSGHFGDGPNMSFRTEVLRSLGGFTTVLGAGTPSLAGEDPDVLVRLLFAGHTLVFDPAAYVAHTHIRDYAELRERMFGYGGGYTAMLTSLIWSDRRHLLGLAAYGLRAVGLLLRKFRGARQAAVSSGEFPAELSRLEFRGLLAGPWLYLRSRRHRF